MSGHSSGYPSKEQLDRARGRPEVAPGQRRRDSRSRSPRPTDDPRGRGPTGREETRAINMMRTDRQQAARPPAAAPDTGELKHSHEVITPDNARVLNYPEFTPRGSLGKPFMPEVNHHLIRCLPKVAIWCFDIEIKVAPDSKHKGKDEASTQQRARLLLKREVLDFFGPDYVFDGVSQIWSPKQIVQEGEVRQTSVAMEERADGLPNNILITIRGKGKLAVAALAKYLLAGVIGLDPASDTTLENPIKWLQACFRKDPAARLITRPNNNCYFGRVQGGYYTLPSTNGVLEARRGVFQTMQIRFGCLTMNVDTATTPFYVPNKCLLESAAAMIGKTMATFNESHAPMVRERATKMIGIYFQVRHLGTRPNAIKLKMNGFANGNALTTTFDEMINKATNQTRKTTVNDYFQRKYHLKLRFPKLPLVKTTKGEFPLEVCFSAEGERYKELLQGKETADFIKYASVEAHDRKLHIETQLRLLSHHSNSTLRAHGIVMEPRMMRVKARVLAPPKLLYGAKKELTPADGSWNLRGARFLRPAIIKSWVLVYVATRQPAKDPEIEAFMKQFVTVFRATGMTTPAQHPPLVIGNPNVKTSDIVAKAIARAEADFGARPDVIFFLVQQGGPPGFYQQVKLGMDVKLGIVSQVMCQEKCLDKKGSPAQYIANISMKVNVKLGGTNCTAHNAMYDKSPCMLLGGDISHPTPAQLRSPLAVFSCAALVGTWDKACTAYTAVTGMQESTYAMIANMRPMFAELIKRYTEKNNNQFPQHIFYYRDGVSESEFKEIKMKEAKVMKDFMNERGAVNCKITLIVAIKRHHTRFFVDRIQGVHGMKAGECGTTKGNVATGTVVENSRHMNDFFLIPHQDLIGTKRPTRYVTVVDENNLDPNTVHMMTNNMCSAYARATRTVAVVPPIYYADQACERARLHLYEDKNTHETILGPVHPNHKWNMWWQ